MNFAWERLGDGVFRCRLPFLDATVGVVQGLTHNHFDHIHGSSAFGHAAVYRAIAALRIPEHQIRSAAIDLGDRTVAVTHPGRGHTDHDLIVVIPAPDGTVVFCGDLVEESGDPSVDVDSDPGPWPETLERVLEAGGDNAVYVPGHGAVVDASFIRGQRSWLRDRL